MQSETLLSPPDDYSMSINKTRQQMTQRISIMSPRLVPTTQIDLNLTKSKKNTSNSRAGGGVSKNKKSNKKGKAGSS